MWKIPREKRVFAKLGMSNPLFIADCVRVPFLGLSSLSRDDTRTLHSCEVHFSAAWCVSFLELSKARAFEASIQRGGSTRTVTFRIADHGRRVYSRTTRRIFDVKVLLPRLVCSASKFQMSCLWNPTRASLPLRQQLACVTYARAPCGKRSCGFIGKFNERKSLLEMLDIYWQRVNKQLIAR